MENTNQFKSYKREIYTEQEIIDRSLNFYRQITQRRSVRTFSDRPIPKKVIENIVMSASSAPSGANKQPWTFCAVGNSQLKMQIREAAEKEEYQNYNGRMPDDWLEDLSKFETDWRKPFLERAPWLIVVFRKNYDLDETGEKKKNYYVSESVGIATGFLLSAIHSAGLVALTHTPSPMKFLERILKRPANEKAFLLIPVGYPTEDMTVPDIKRKKAGEVLKFYE